MISLGPMAYLASKEKGDNSMPSKPSLVPRRTGRGDDGPRDMAKAELPQDQSPDGAKRRPLERHCNRCQPLRQGVRVCCNPPGLERCPMRAFKGMSGPPEFALATYARDERGIA